MSKDRRKVPSNEKTMCVRIGFDVMDHTDHVADDNFFNVAVTYHDLPMEVLLQIEKRAQEFVGKLLEDGMAAYEMKRRK